MTTSVGFELRKLSVRVP